MQPYFLRCWLSSHYNQLIPCWFKAWVTRRQNICETAKDDKLWKIKLCNKNDAQNILKVTFKQVLNNIQLFTICIYVCMYVFIYIYIYTNKYTDTYFKLHIHIHLCICRYINKTMKGSAEKHIRLKAILLYCFFSLVWCWRSSRVKRLSA